MKILFISEHYKHNIQGGGEINLFSLCEELVRQGNAVSVLTSRNGLNEKQKVTENGVTVYQYLSTGNVGTLSGNVKRLFLSRQIAKELQGIPKHDVIHLIGSTLGAAKKIRSQTKQTPYTTVESYIALCPKGDFISGKKVSIKPWSFLELIQSIINSKEIGKMPNKWYIRYNPISWIAMYCRYKNLLDSLNYTRIFAVSEFVKNVLQEFGFKSIVVPNFVDIAQFKTTKTSEKKEVVVLYMGSLNEYKGPQVLLEAAKGLNCKLQFYGNGPLKNSLQKKINKYKINAEIHAPVDYKKVPEIYQKADIVVFPSLWPEPFGRIAIEAMASRKAVIGSNIGGIKETIKDCGICVTPGNVSELNNSLNLLIENKKKREEFARKGYTRAKIYAKEVVVKKLVEIYKNNKTSF